MPGVTRSAGYEAGRGKEAEAAAIAVEFLVALTGLGFTRVVGRDNFERGDVQATTGVTVEVKGQPIDPLRYRRNFVEVFEDVSAAARPCHANGFEATAALLRIAPDDLAAMRVHDRRTGRWSTLGRLSHVSASLHTLETARAIVYVNPRRRIVCWYASRDLLASVRAVALADGLQRGMGRSNDDTFAALVPYPECHWVQEPDGCFLGRGAAPADDRERLETALRCR